MIQRLRARCISFGARIPVMNLKIIQEARIYVCLSHQFARVRVVLCIVLKCKILIKIWNCSWASKVAVFFCPSFLITNSNITLKMFSFWFCCYKSFIIVKRCPNSWIDQRWVLIFIFSIFFFRQSISKQCNSLTMLLEEDAFKVSYI